MFTLVLRYLIENDLQKYQIMLRIIFFDQLVLLWYFMLRGKKFKSLSN